MVSWRWEAFISPRPLEERRAARIRRRIGRVSGGFLVVFRRFAWRQASLKPNKVVFGQTSSLHALMQGDEAQPAIDDGSQWVALKKTLREKPEAAQDRASHRCQNLVHLIPPMAYKPTVGDANVDKFDTLLAWWTARLVRRSFE